MLMFLQPLETERKSNLLQKFIEHMSDNTATRSVTLIIINDESDNFSLGSHPMMMLAPTYCTTQRAQQKVKAC